MSRRRPALSVVSPASEPRLAPAAVYQANRCTGGVFYPGSVNHCPNCGETAFDVRRITATCIECGEPLGIAPSRLPARVPFTDRKDHP